MKSLETRRTTNLLTAYTARTYRPTSLSVLMLVIICLLSMLLCYCWSQYVYKDPSQHRAANSKMESTNGDKAILSSSNGRMEYNVKERSSSVVTQQAQPTWNITSCYSYHGKKRLKSQRELQEMGCERKLPKVLIIGVKKCGTITLSLFLDLHPEIQTRIELDFNPNVEDWLKQMPMSTSDQISIVDFPGYIDDPKLLQYMVSNIIHDLKLIVILRDPVKRAISDYVHVSEKITWLRKTGNLKELAIYRSSKRSSQNITAHQGYEMLGNFEETITDNHGNLNTSHLFIRKGIYIEYIKNLFENVDRNRVLIIDGDAFMKNPLLALKKVEKFLRLSDFFTDEHFYFSSKKGFFCANVTGREDTKCMTPNKGRSHPTVPQHLLQQMSDFFTPYSLKLQEYLNQTLTFSYHESGK
ncbi:heparan sulfate glucosamine 3-O-sulfotransferase 1-like [Amphiura filiformis]|uniref:heparan sulfate glucosamine 3-O-sulfotransferase 1-like n=1 Tax=Amphiura filiformis TaxID=82378 RepID=UPI003B21406C